MSQGKLIVLAGGEGCGKSTCVKRLKELLPPGHFIFTREPGGSENAEKIRDFFLKNELIAYEELLAVELARALHFREKVLPALHSGLHVICDRCCEATWAYQIAAKEKEDELGKLFALLDHHSRAGHEVDLWIHFNIGVEEALNRRMQDGSEVNIFDSRPLEYHMRVRKGLDHFFKQHRLRVCDVDATLPKEDVAHAVHRTLMSFCHL